MCPIYRGVRLIESEIKKVNKDKGQLYVSDLQRCPLRESEIKGIKKDKGQLYVSDLQRCPLRRVK